MSRLDVAVQVGATDATIKELADMWTGYLDHPVLPEHVRPMLAMLVFVDGVQVREVSKKVPAVSVGKVAEVARDVDVQHPAIHFTDEELREDWLIAGAKVRAMAKKARAFEELYDKALSLCVKRNVGGMNNRLDALEEYLERVEKLTR